MPPFSTFVYRAKAKSYKILSSSPEDRVSKVYTFLHIVGEMIGSNLGPTPRDNQRRQKWILLSLCHVQDIKSENGVNALGPKQTYIITMQLGLFNTKVVQTKN